MIQYKHIPLQDTVKIDSIVNASRQKIGKNFVFEGESHNFWEMQYAALGTAIICTKNEFYELRQGQLTFFSPNKFHVLYGNGHRSSELWVFSFRCDSPLMEKFDQILINPTTEIQQLMESIIKESERNFVSEPAPTDGRILRRRPHTSFGYEQSIKNLLEVLLLYLFRQESSRRELPNAKSINSHWLPDSLAEEIHFYLESHIHSTISLQQIADMFNLSVTYIKKLYRVAYSTGIISDFNQMKLREIKHVLSSTSLSISEISALFDFRSVYYFSNFFKRHTGMSPTTYRKIVTSQ